MPRPKGSKNKAPRKITVANNDFDTLIAEKTSAKENLTVEIASLEEKLMADGMSASEILEKLK